MLKLYRVLLEGLPLLLAFARFALPIQFPAHPTTANTKGYVGNEACARCHSSIYNSYSRTNMAHASGPANRNLMSADFVHQESHVHYRIYLESERVWLSFERSNDPSTRGKRELLYYIGSGHRGRTYLFMTDGFLFESPVNWYGNKHTWDMTPAYQNAKEIPLNLPVFTSCLHCHVSEMKPPLRGTENRYAMPLFIHSGVTCERCHGPGAAHVNGGAIVNPAKLPAPRRDEICMQCHLEGRVAIERPGRHVYEYRPGENLADYIRYYVLSDKRGLGAVSQVEALAQSVCKKKSGDAMSCTSCHDPHYSPSSEERVSYYRGRCLACHGEAFGAKHHPSQADCTACHMPAMQSTDVAHTQVTDHRIPRRPDIAPERLMDANTGSSSLRLVPFPYSSEGERDLRDRALAWESLAESGIKSAGPEAERLVRSALAQSPDDAALLSSLGYIEQRRGAADRARELYQKALAVDPDLIDAATNLGVLEAKEGHWRDAVKYWNGAFQRAPGRSAIGMNIARIFCEAAKFEEARSYVLRVLQFNPDMESAKKFLQQLDSTPSHCGP